MAPDHGAAMICVACGSDMPAGRSVCFACRWRDATGEKLPPAAARASVPAMRTLTRDELVAETLHRITLNRPAGPSKLDRDLVGLIADMIELARERVPDCYTQATPTPPTAPGRGWTHEPPEEP